MFTKLFILKGVLTRVGQIFCILHRVVFCLQDMRWVGVAGGLTLWMPSSLTRTLWKRVLKALLRVKAKKRIVLTWSLWAISSRMATASSWRMSGASPASFDTCKQTSLLRFHSFSFYLFNQDSHSASVVVKLLDLDPQGRWFDPWCGHDKICTAVGPLSKALNPTLLQGEMSPA